MIAFICGRELITITKRFQQIYSWFIFSLSNWCRPFKHLFFSLFFFRGATHQSNINSMHFKRLLHGNTCAYDENENVSQKNKSIFTLKLLLHSVWPIPSQSLHQHKIYIWKFKQHLNSNSNEWQKKIGIYDQYVMWDIIVSFEYQIYLWNCFKQKRVCGIN